MQHAPNSPTMGPTAAAQPAQTAAALAPTTPRPAGFVGVHIGAGQHSEARTHVYLTICARACQVGVSVLKAGGTALEAAAQATMVLEDAEETNAGYGSNLTEHGGVEMDAGIMDGSNLLFGAVGAMPGIKNPVLVAKLLVDEQQKGLLPLGRVPPGFLVGQGARDWAVRHGVPTVENDSQLISEKSNKLFRHYKKKLDAFRLHVQQKQQQKRQRSSPSRLGGGDGCETKKKHADTAALNHNDDDRVTDTVGVVVMDPEGRVASTVSSGGIALKQPGRVGQASCFGCGCWAQSRTQPHGLSVGISTTGCGEHLVRTFLARECAADMARSQAPLLTLRSVMRDKFAESEFLAGVPEKLGGVICMHYDPRAERGEFLWTHTTSSMGVAFQTTEDATATTRMSRLPPQSQNGGVGAPTTSFAGTTILVESMPFTTKSRTPSTTENGTSSASSLAPMDHGEEEVEILTPMHTVESAKA